MAVASRGSAEAAAEASASSKRATEATTALQEQNTAFQAEYFRRQEESARSVAAVLGVVEKLGKAVEGGNLIKISVARRGWCVAERAPRGRPAKAATARTDGMELRRREGQLQGRVSSSHLRCACV